MSSKTHELASSANKILASSFLSTFLEQMNHDLDTMSAIVSDIHRFYANASKKQPSHPQLTIYKSALLKKLNEIWPRPTDENFEETYASFLAQLNELNDQLPQYESVAQKAERFNAVSTDNYWVKWLKKMKNMAFLISRWPQSFLNLFRKNKNPRTYWKHQVPLRNLAKKHFLIDTVDALHSLNELYYSALVQRFVSIKKWEEGLAKKETVTEISLEEIEKFRQSMTDEISAKCESIIQSNSEAFEIAYETAGTFELPGWKLGDSNITKALDQAYAQWNNQNLCWKNTVFALFEEWRLDLNILFLRHSILARMEEFRSAQSKKVNEFVRPEFEAIRQFIKEGLSTLSTSTESIQKTLTVLNYHAAKKLDKDLVPRLCEKLANQSVINLINHLEVNIEQQVENLSDERIIVKADGYEHAIKSSELNNISPRELITFEMLPGFKSKISTIKQNSFAGLQTTADNIKDLDHIITFSLSSAIAALNTDGDAHEALLIAEEGLKRAQLRLQEEQDKLDESIGANTSQLEFAVDEFCQKVMELTFNENVRELRMRVTKAKAAQQAQVVKQKFQDRLKRSRHAAVLSLLNIFNRTRHALTSVSERFVLTAKKPEITKQVSDFLLESQQKIDKLPLIYKRLYQIEPLEDLELFEGREEEFLTLKKAFESWQKGRYAASIVIGEKWGGLTSFLTYTLAKARFTHLVTRLAVDDNGYSTAHLIQVFKKLLQQDHFNDVSDIISHLNESPNRIIVLEDIQNLFLRKIYGFEALQSLFQIINQTYKSVFWITSTTAYAWAYLMKTVNINEYFSYTVSLKSLTDEQIINLIWKRNRISGFKILFEVDPDMMSQRKFKKLNDEERQVALKNKYFSDLNAFAQSNISLALIYWLLSTRDIDDTTITIGTFKRPNLNFLSMLSMDKLYALHALILHDGLSLEQLSQVLVKSKMAAELTLLALLEDGVVVRKEDTFVINPIVYRNTVSLLHAKNLIH